MFGNAEYKFVFKFYFPVTLSDIFTVYLLVDFNGMLIHLELFYAKRLENRVHSMFIFIF